MSEQTQIIGEDSELLPEALVTPKRAKSKAGGAIAAGAAAGVGAIAYDSYAGDDTKKDETTPSGIPSADTENKTDSTATVPADSEVIENNPAQDTIPAHQPTAVLIPDHLSIVNAPDNMSFDEAFAWSREEAGPAQLFEWKGELYHTCHAHEYAALPTEMKELFQDMWLDNAFGFSELPAEGYMVSYDYDMSPAVESSEVAADTTTTDSTATDATIVAEQDSVSMDTDEYGIVYTQEDYDNDFEGVDEWVNPEDIA
ncbi:hypothetical protein LZD49_23660 [Dyadobacter sp. CY261]|uniref:hypothetical protein n=1 Tax=Dyadobacter sp. CY261 TaxID=2907203 RepID=UPI001F35BA4C|nr:hypothetical protein [Dyadobacter sp. CY261]MCF0073496.1 hypothetical protein [Dyadobacter sp. CY261]